MQLEPIKPKKHFINNWELNRLCDDFNLRAEGIREIVKKVGTRAEDIKKFLAKKKAL